VAWTKRGEWVAIDTIPGGRLAAIWRYLLCQRLRQRYPRDGQLQRIIDTLYRKRRGLQVYTDSFYPKGVAAGGKTAESSPPTGSQICRMLPFSLLVVDRKPHQPLPSMYKILDMNNVIFLTYSRAQLISLLICILLRQNPLSKSKTNLFFRQGTSCSS
jgi:hypothetical protein